jgi:hypothetical protein
MMRMRRIAKGMMTLLITEASALDDKQSSKFPDPFVVSSPLRIRRDDDYNSLDSFGYWRNMS